MEKEYEYTLHQNTCEGEYLIGTIYASDYINAIEQLVRIYRHQIDFIKFNICDKSTPSWGEVTFSREAIKDILGEDNNG